MKRLITRILATLFLAAAVAGAIAYRTWPRTLELTPPTARRPAFQVTSGHVSLQAPADAVLGEVARFHDELVAYLRFEYLRSRPEIAANRVLLTFSETPDGPLYRIELVLNRNLLTAVPYLANLRAAGIIRGYGYSFHSASQLGYKRRQTELLVAAYNFPVRRRLETLSPALVMSPLMRFLLFKSETDRRVTQRIEPVPSVLSSEAAHQLASDIMTVAQFYDLPLDVFLGIGAMENNYMNVTGDSEHAVWKRRAEKGDIVLRRRRGRVLIRNSAIGEWQITRETLRHAHELYLKDHRDYSLLPAHLRPPETLDLDAVPPSVLTTYAGLLLRDLLDRFHGDVTKAVGAYNGGPGKPNLSYAEGVAVAAAHARRVVEQAVVLNGHRAAETRFITVWNGRDDSLRVQRRAN